MFCKLKTIVVFLRIISDIIGLRNFGSTNPVNQSEGKLEPFLKGSVLQSSGRGFYNTYTINIFCLFFSLQVFI